MFIEIVFAKTRNGKMQYSGAKSHLGLSKQPCMMKHNMFVATCGTYKCAVRLNLRGMVTAPP